MAGRLKEAGWVGAGLAGGLAAWTGLNRAAVRRFSRRDDRVGPGELEAPPGVREHALTASDGWTVRVIECGPPAGRPVLLLHGITLSAAVWPYQLRDLADRGCRVLAVDLRGHGGSGPAPGSGPPSRGAPGLTLDRLADDVYEVMEQLDLRHAVVVGHSMGGMVALRMLERRPDQAAGLGRVAGLVLAATSASATRRRGMPGLSDAVALSQPLASSLAGLAARLPGPTLPAHDLAFLLARVTFGRDSSPGQVLFTGRMTSDVPVRVSAGLLLEILHFDAEDLLSGLGLPVTIVVGDHDLMTPLTQSRFMAARIPEASLVVLPGCGHMVMLERPAELDEAIADLIRRVESRADRSGPPR
ncbi:MAG TPA: alpha/beta hydrolase [Acidimicrobiales bacterium]|nr:alpha/beta hydrolase [Acidimicrobiales bacterium]